MTPQDLAAAHPGRFGYLASPYSKYRRPGFDYAASPIRTDYLALDHACEDVAQVAGRLIATGLPLYSPIAHSHTVCAAAQMDFWDHKVWLALDKTMLDAAAFLIVAAMDGWDESFGVGEELRWFFAAGKPVYLLPMRPNLTLIGPLAQSLAPYLAPGA